jgi:hypothetical protein
MKRRGGIYLRVSNAERPRNERACSASRHAFVARALFFYIANDCLSAAVHMDVFDADILLPPMTQASENLYLHRIRFH